MRIVWNRLILRQRPNATRKWSIEGDVKNVKKVKKVKKEISQFLTYYFPIQRILN